MSSPKPEKNWVNPEDRRSRTVAARSDLVGSEYQVTVLVNYVLSRDRPNPLKRSVDYFK